MKPFQVIFEHLCLLHQMEINFLHNPMSSGQQITVTNIHLFCFKRSPLETFGVWFMENPTLNEKEM